MKHALASCIAVVVGVPCLTAEARETRPPTPANALTLWYRAPASEWLQALPVGNGQLGAMVFGGVERERVQLNEHALWSGHRAVIDSPQTLEYLPRVRALLFAGRIQEAQAMASQFLMVRDTSNSYGTYQTLGDLTLDIERSAAPPSAYRRELDLTTGIARVSYQDAGLRVTREVLASQPDRAIVVRVESDTPGRLALAARLSREANASVAYEAPGRIVMRGRAGSDGVTFV